VTGVARDLLVLRENGVEIEPFAESYLLRSDWILLRVCNVWERCKGRFPGSIIGYSR
jgi:hypothetical protein